MKKEKSKKPLVEKDQKFNLPEDEKDNLPEFPSKDQKESDSGLGTSEEEGLADVDLEEVAGDLIGVPFEIWAILKKGVKPLSQSEKKLIAKPLSRVLVKYDVARFCKDEFLLLGFLGFAVMKRVRVKDDSDESSKT